MHKKIALGMSGGVDSSLCAHLLKEQGYQVTGVFLECWRAPGCRTDQDRKDALKVALELNIPFQVLDFKQAYKDKVVEYFFAEYEASRTPNPDVMCNKEIKFGLFYDWAIEQGFDAVATGHYAKTINGQLLIPKDKHKDQTYFLYLLTQEQLRRIVFPLGDFTKNEVRAEAEKRNIHVAHKPDSVGICFIGDINVRQFLQDRLGKKRGEVINIEGNVIGTHDGIWFYTIGQRHGFQLNADALIKRSDGSIIQRTQLPPLYVIDKNADNNQLVVGLEKQTLHTKFMVNKAHLIDQSIDLPKQVMVRIRHGGALIPASINQSSRRLIVKLNRPTKGIAPGQAAVFYQRQDSLHQCLGGSIIVL